MTPRIQFGQPAKATAAKRPLAETGTGRMKTINLACHRTKSLSNDFLIRSLQRPQPIVGTEIADRERVELPSMRRHPAHQCRGSRRAQPLSIQVGIYRGIDDPEGRMSKAPSQVANDRETLGMLDTSRRGQPTHLMQHHERRVRRDTRC